MLPSEIKHPLAGTGTRKIADNNWQHPSYFTSYGVSIIPSGWTANKSMFLFSGPLFKINRSKGLARLAYLDLILVAQAFIGIFLYKGEILFLLKLVFDMLVEANKLYHKVHNLIIV